MTNLYVRDSLLIDMTAEEKNRRDACSAHTDQIGKVFIVLGQDVRQCMICDAVFTRQASAEHAEVSCFCQSNAG